MNTVVTVALSTIGGAIVGGAVTYLTVNKALRTRYEDWANEEIDAVKRHYSLLRKEDGLTILGANKPDAETIAVGQAIIDRLGYSGEEREETDSSEEGDTPPNPEDETISSIWDREIPANENGEPIIDTDEVDTQNDAAQTPEYVREEGKPYLITEAEFFENEDDYELDTLTYYEQDDTLTDEKDMQIPNVEATVGARHLHMFNLDKGNAKNSIYIRNDDHQSLYEVILNESSYASVVYGVDESEPSKPRIRRMRDDD